MTKGELRKLRKSGEIKYQHPNQVQEKPKRTVKRTYKPRYASREEQHARYIDCGPGAWDDR